MTANTDPGRGHRLRRRDALRHRRASLGLCAVRFFPPGKVWIMPAHRKPVDQVRRPKTLPGFRRLPHEGRSGDPPAWPLSAASAAEKREWARVWTLPQAVEWERTGCEHTVALYVRLFVAVSLDISHPKMLAEVRQLDGLIGLSPRAMLQLRWEIDDAPEPEPMPPSSGEVRAYVPD